jgi:hypothetical protein
VPVQLLNTPSSCRNAFPRKAYQRKKPTLVSPEHCDWLADSGAGGGVDLRATQGDSQTSEAAHLLSHARHA